MFEFVTVVSHYITSYQCRLLINIRVAAISETNSNK